MIGIGFALLTALTWGISAIAVRYGLQHMNAATGAVISVVSGAPIVWALALAQDWASLDDITLLVVVWFAAVGLLNFGLGRMLSFFSVRELGVSLSAPLLNSYPLFSMVLAVLFLGEDLNALIVLGMLLVLVGLYIVVREGAQS